MPRPDSVSGLQRWEWCSFLDSRIPCRVRQARGVTVYGVVSAYPAPCTGLVRATRAYFAGRDKRSGASYQFERTQCARAQTHRSPGHTRRWWADPESALRSPPQPGHIFSTRSGMKAIFARPRFRAISAHELTWLPAFRYHRPPVNDFLRSSEGPCPHRRNGDNAA